MSRYSGPQGPGAAQRSRKQRREQAFDRNEATPYERTAEYRRMKARIRAALVDAAAGNGPKFTVQRVGART